MSYPIPTKTILFLGATGGCALSTLRRSLAAGHTCIAVCRTPSKLLALLPADQRSLPTLHTVQGNATDTTTVARALVYTPSAPGAAPTLVDTIVFALGGAFDWKKFDNDQPTLCQDAMKALLAALTHVRAASPALAAAPPPRIVAVSTTGIPDSGVRDVPRLLAPLYHVLLKEPHKDKKAMEGALKGSQTRWTIARASLLTDGNEGRKVRVGVEDPVKGTLESSAVGYTISREDVGKWIFENVVQGGDRFVGKAVTLTY
ncbi:hypothetical protein QBC39DRAFT_362981 [Podospora conica]|nr:hypothetical protein QBC39DRAFT_362981 [Schizothecium conicum]